MKKRIKWDIVIDLIMLAIFSILTIYLLGAMVVRGLNLIETILMLGLMPLTNGSLCNVIEE